MRQKSREQVHPPQENDPRDYNFHMSGTCGHWQIDVRIQGRSGDSCTQASDIEYLGDWTADQLIGMDYTESVIK